MPDTEVIWTSPAPVWANVDDPRSETARLAFRQPALLRFATDSFMEEFISTLDADPTRVSQLRAQPESWREPLAPLPPLKSLPPFAREFIRSGLGTARRAQSLVTNVPAPQNGNAISVSPSTKPLKLYHPAHQRFYLVTASLTCQTLGLPDRVVNTGSQERVSFVIRRLLPSANSNPPINAWDEYAFVGGAWQKLDQPETTLATGEEELPLSPLTYPAQDGRKRRVWAGLIPVGKREAYLGATAAPATGETNGGNTSPATPSPREVLLIAQVIEPWKSLITQAENTRRRAEEARIKAQAEGKLVEAQAENAKLITATRSQLQEASWYVLLDFAQYLEDQLNPVWIALKNNAPGDATTPEGRLITALRNTQFPIGFTPDLIAGTPYLASQVAGSLAEALVKIKDSEADQLPENSLENKLTAYDRTGADAPTWPNFLFPLADPAPTLRIPQPPGTPNPAKPLAEAYMDLLDALKSTILAVPTTNTAPLPVIPVAAQPPLLPGDPGNFLIRCIYQRPNCGPSQPPLISAPTPVFQLAAFFDPDAPARPIRIALPVDTTPAGLRKFNKNTAFVISDVLCGQIDRAKGLGLADLVLSVLPFPFHKSLSLPDKGPCQDDNQLSLGMICSLSIPIVTICALILLMIIISLLDFIFRWMPFFIMCFPLPGLKAKPAR